MRKGLLFLLIISISIFGAGIVDSISEVVPLRPYDVMFRSISIAPMQTIGNGFSSSLSIPFLLLATVVILMVLSVTFHIPIFGIMLTKSKMEHTISLKHRRGETVEVTNFNKVDDNSEKVVRKRRRLRRKPTKVDQYEILVHGSTSVPLVMEEAV